MSAKNQPAPKKIPNNWKLHHNSLNDEEKKAARSVIMAACEWSQATFYLKMGNGNGLRNFEKNVIAAAYGKKVEMFFPENAMIA